MHRIQKVLLKIRFIRVVPQDKLEAVIEDLQHRGGKWYQDQVREKMHTTYAYGNRVALLSILRTLEISEDLSDYAPILKAINFINEH